jgi:hypothetical protein
MNSLKKLEQIAYEQIHGDLNTLNGIKNRLISWFCFTFNTTPTDNRLLEMTVEELIIFYLSHKIYNDPSYASKFEKDDYEEWLQSAMGDNYTSEEQMIQTQKKEEEREQKIFENIKNKLPSKITTDFDQFKKED